MARNHVVIADIEDVNLSDVGDTGIARRRVELRQLRRLAELPGQRMLAPARADEKNVHDRRPTPIWRRRLAGRDTRAHPGNRGRPLFAQPFALAAEVIDN